jgi:hypothetical protein
MLALASPGSAAMASRSLRRSPTIETPRSFRSSAVRLGRARWHGCLFLQFTQFFPTLSSPPHDFHNHRLVPLPIKLGIKDPLPPSQIEFAMGDRHYDLMMDQQRFKMRVAVVFTRVMMLVIFAKRRQMYLTIGRCPRSGRFHCR